VLRQEYSMEESSQVKSSRLEIGPLLLTYLFSEGTYVSTYDVSPHYGPLRHLRPLPSSTAGFRSTFDRLPYGCLLFMYRLDLTWRRRQSKDRAEVVGPQHIPLQRKRGSYLKGHGCRPTIVLSARCV